MKNDLYSVENRIRRHLRRLLPEVFLLNRLIYITLSSSYFNKRCGYIPYLATFCTEDEHIVRKLDNFYYVDLLCFKAKAPIHIIYG